MTPFHPVKTKKPLDGSPGRSTIPFCKRKALFLESYISYDIRPGIIHEEIGPW
jgi:hypothetical protein